MPIYIFILVLFDPFLKKIIWLWTDFAEIWYLYVKLKNNNILFVYIFQFRS